MAERPDHPTARAATGLQCWACERAFGFDVRFCPFCGVAQRASPPPPVVRSLPPVVPPPVAAVVRAVPPPAAAPPAVAAPTPPPGSAPARAKTPKPARSPAPVQPPRPLRARRRPGGFWPWAAALTGVWALLHLRPLGNGPAQGSLTVIVSPNVAGSILLDGKPAGRPGEALRVLAGTHLVGFQSADWLAVPRRVDVDATQPYSIALHLLHRAERLQEAPGRPDRAVMQPAGPGSLSMVSAHDWVTREYIAGPRKLCGVEASVNGGTLLLYGGSEKPSTLRLLLHKDLWRIPDLIVPVIIAFTDGPTFTFEAQGSGADIAADIPVQDVRDFIHQFTADQQATLTLRNGRELPWTVDLRGTSPTITAMAKCLEVAELWLPPPFTQPGG